MTESSRPSLVRWMALTIDCPEPVVLAEFYASVLGGKVTRDHGDAFVEAQGWYLVFRAVPDYRPSTWPSSQVPLHSHFELVVDDPEAAVQELESLGATLAGHQDPDDPNIVVMLDPASHPFCVIRSSAATRY